MVDKAIVLECLDSIEYFSIFSNVGYKSYVYRKPENNSRVVNRRFSHSNSPATRPEHEVCAKSIRSTVQVFIHQSEWSVLLWFCSDISHTMSLGHAQGYVHFEKDGSTFFDIVI